MPRAQGDSFKLSVCMTNSSKPKYSQFSHFRSWNQERFICASYIYDKKLFSLIIIISYCVSTTWILYHYS